jgi:hypothetical protein
VQSSKSNQLNPRQPAGRARKEQRAAPAGGVADAALIQRHGDNLAGAPPTIVRALQRTIGNRAVSRMAAAPAPQASPGRAPFIQTRLAIGPAADPYELEADRVAAQVMQPPGGGAAVSAPGGAHPPAPAIQTLAAAPEAGPQGGAAGPAVESRLAARRGGGNPLPADTRAFMESRFDADFGGVRLHTGGEPARLSRQLNAQAFTYGSDIYLGAGQYNPRSSNGQRLLAHELTHVVQQTGKIGRKANKAPAAATWGGGRIQRKDGDNDPPGGIGQVDPNKQTEQQQDQGNQTDDPIGQIQAITQDLTPNFSPQSEAPPVNFNVTVGVAQGLPEYMAFAKKRMRSVIRNKARAFLRGLPGLKGMFRKEKSSDEIKQRAAEKAAPQGQDGQPNPQDVARIVQNSDSVGHAWIKFTLFDAADEAITTYSFGFLPGNTPTNPQQAVAGVVRNPDLEFETDPHRRFLTSGVTAKEFLKGLRKATGLMANPPQYMTIGYNCTKFTHDVARAAGAEFPSKAGLMMPFSSLGLLKRALSPNALYDKLGKNDETETESPEGQLLQSKDFAVSGEGTIMPVEEAFTADDIYKMIYRNRYVAGQSHINHSREYWEGEGLRADHLRLLSQEQINDLVGDEIDVKTIFQNFGLPHDNIRALRRRGGFGDVNPYWRGY